MHIRDTADLQACLSVVWLSDRKAQSHPPNSCAGVQSMRWLSSLQDRDIELLELMEQHRQLQVTSLIMNALLQASPKAPFKDGVSTHSKCIAQRMCASGIGKVRTRCNIGHRVCMAS